MLRFMGGRMHSIVRNSIVPRSTTVLVQNVRASHGENEEPEEEFNNRYVTYLSRSDLDHWDVRQVMNRLAGVDCVPDPSIVCAALRACRKLNDYALAVRFLEVVKDKCGPKVKEIYPYILQEIKPTLDELGVNTPEELGYDKPELALQSVYDM
ncbi:PREDICTED: cytochrome c oxidase subunit 5A, mitochondrial [Dufourea novaeangliae]|uniref:Cytochrome c oxidase subunit 5A, mitochondrial n=1 Tax=Dufourea novaeangliae TaxID=178035 RepID=A0A154P588_DUFNO|nr:PREDICTED: cytochrome c oxidase subunit 5A, mitochondrial [Dufourea novaeangliae]KZC06290.1 Cytochrome c oxidase subunit 5A, mitochondrial [Dufourea novaeangliae]